jgi:hypothetical protein
MLPLTGGSATGRSAIERAPSIDWQCLILAPAKRAVCRLSDPWRVKLLLRSGTAMGRAGRATDDYGVIAGKHGKLP